MTSQNEVANLLASRFIARTDVRAVQHSSGSYEPIREPWTRASLADHIEGKATYGHYLVDKDDTCKLFCFDIDLRSEPKPNDPHPPGWFGWTHADGDYTVGDARQEWTRNGPGKPWLTVQLRCLAEGLAVRTERLLDIPVAVAYSGNKGLHVYGFTGRLPASEVRGAAVMILESYGCFAPSKGTNFYRHTSPELECGYPALEIEVFPKQESLQGKDLGNLLRLPLGINQKSKQPGFFLNRDTRMDELVPADPTDVL